MFQQLSSYVFHSSPPHWHLIKSAWSSVSPACSDAVDSVTSLYNHVEEQAHVLVQRSNMSLEHLEYLLQLREMEGLFLQVQWNRSPSAFCFRTHQA